MTPSDPPGDRPADSLFDRVLGAARDIGTRKRVVAGPIRRANAEKKTRSRTSWLFSVLLAGLIALGPALTWLGALVLQAQARTEARALENRARPRLTARRDAAIARATLRQALSGPTVAGLLDRLATVLPEDARLSYAEVRSDGTTELQVATGDPDRLREALHRDPALAGLHDIEQRRGDAVMLVTLRKDVR